MLNRNNTLGEKYFGFDDRKFMIIGILLIAFILFPVFSGMDLSEYYLHAKVELPEGIVLTCAFWLSYRFIFIKLRMKYPKIDHTKKRIRILLVVMFLSAPIIGKVFSGSTHLVMGYLGFEDCVHMGFYREIIVTYFLSFSVLATYEAIYYFIKYRDAIKETAQLKTAQVQSELDNLRNQINPHFLFNSLNTLMNIIPRDQDRAVSYLGKLSKFYRYSVGKHEAPLVDLSDELCNAKLYGELLKERFGNNINIDITQERVHKQVVPLSLQLLIENAVKHNIVSKSKPLNISVNITEDRKYIKIKNNLQKKIQEVKSTGVGLANITQRFKFFTDEEVLVEADNGFFEVSLPLI